MFRMFQGGHIEHNQYSIVNHYKTISNHVMHNSYATYEIVTHEHANVLSPFGMFFLKSSANRRYPACKKLCLNLSVYFHALHDYLKPKKNTSVSQQSISSVLISSGPLGLCLFECRHCAKARSDSMLRSWNSSKQMQPIPGDVAEGRTSQNPWIKRRI